MTINQISIDDFLIKCKEQAKSMDLVVFKCPLCKTLQNAQDLVMAEAGNNFDEIEKYLGFSCVGRFLDAPAPREKPDGKPCNWTLGGLFSLHNTEIITEDGKKHPRFELATNEEAALHIQAQRN